METSEYWQVLSELRSLRRYCERTGEVLADLLHVSPRQIEELRAYAAANPEDAAMVEQALEFRAVMAREAGL